MSQIYQRKYGVLLTTAKAITFSLFEVDGVDLRIDATFAVGDVTISKDGGAEGNTTNLPVDEGKGRSSPGLGLAMSQTRYPVPGTWWTHWVSLQVPCHL